MDMIPDEKTLNTTIDTSNSGEAINSEQVEEITAVPEEDRETLGTDQETTEVEDGVDSDTMMENNISDEGDSDHASNEDCSIEKLKHVISAINDLSEKIEKMSKQFDAKIMHTAHEEKIVDQMHSELQKYKEDMYAQLVRPILIDIIEVRDSILRVSQAYNNKPVDEQDIPLKTFSDYAYDVQDILEKNNITIYRSNEGEAFAPIKQRVVKKISTPVEELHGKIAESLSDGYEYLGKTVSPEKISVYVYEAPSKKEGEQK